MEVYSKPFYQFLEGSSKTFIIPVYQRDYAWKMVNCEKLWKDICDLNNNSRSDHFLGTLVTIGSGYEEYSIIDGQQRLTTISLLLLALYNYLKNKLNKTEEEQKLEFQTLDFLVNKYASDYSKRIRLKPNKQDKDNFEKLFDDTNLEEANSNIITNYKFFLNKISEESIPPLQVFKAFQKLKIVQIHLVRGQDDPQLIFESLNSTGVDLSAGDLIRNYILMDLESEIQEDYYKKYWIEIEKNTDDVAEFIRYYLNYKKRVSVKRDDVYSYFKLYSNEQYGKSKDLILEDLVKYSKIFGWFLQNNIHPNSKINTGLNRLKNLEFSVCYPYLFDVFTDLENKSIEAGQVLQILSIIESYAFRKLLVDNTTQGLNKLFITLARDIKKEQNWAEQYTNILSCIILEKSSSQKIPNDIDFEYSIMNKEVYKQSKNRNFLLESLENNGNAYPVNLHDLTVEHIMPQNLKQEWKDRLGENWLEIHTKYLHTLGNLTLTANNSELSNNDYDKKQKIDFQNSRLKLNFDVHGVASWGEAEIVSRAQNLAKEAINIWPYPTTTYQKLIPDEQIFDLSDEDSFSKQKPATLSFQDDTKIVIKSWRNMLSTVCKFLYNYSPTEFCAIMQNQEYNWYFNINKPMATEVEFENNKFVEGNMSANSILSFLRQLCNEMKYEPEKIQFTLKGTVNDI